MVVFTTSVLGQSKFEFNGQLSGFGNYSPDSELDVLVGGRYIPEINYGIMLDSTKALDFEASINMYGSVLFQPFDTAYWDGGIQPYRIWARYTGKRYEVRLGLQKIDFGSATLLRALQWFNQIDPRDPLQLTNGVYGALGRYYFRNNANIWLWVLYGNDELRGYDALGTYVDFPEFGGRVQYPVPKGEIAFSYNYRKVNISGVDTILPYNKIPENRVAVDGKWDVGVGVWFELSYVHRAENIGLLTNQTLLNLGVDYTFGIGNGLNVVAEHLVMAYHESSINIRETINTTAINLTYPITMYDNLNCIMYYSYDEQAFSFFLNYEHQFKRVSAYVMAYYNPEVQSAHQENELTYTTYGPGIRLMIVFNH